MPFTAPKLDNRTFEELFEQARNRIPFYLPEWTDWNDSDPGITLLQLHAWLTETVLFRLNQLPELNYIKFLELLGVDRRAARPASADLTFTLRADVGEPELIIPAGVRVQAADRDLEEPVFFETDRSLVAIAATLGLLVQAPTTGPSLEVTHANEADGQTILPFCGSHGATGACSDGQDATVGAALLLGFSSSLPMSREEIGLTFNLADNAAKLLADPNEATCDDDGSSTRPTLAWEWWDGIGWSLLDVIADETRSLTQSGHVYLKIPGQIPRVAAQAVGGPVHATPLLEEIAGVTAAIASSLRAGTTGHAPVITVDELARLTAEELFGFLDSRDPDVIPPDELATLAVTVATILADAGRIAGREEPLYYWLSVRLQSGLYLDPPRIDRILTNTVQATAALTVANEVIGTSNGRPNLTLSFEHAPVLSEPVAVLEVPEGGRSTIWEQVDDFSAAAPDSQHYVLDRSTGQVTFGDGRRGRIPPALTEPIVARTYRHGGGAAGNVAPGTISTVVGAIPGVKNVTNHLAAVGGSDEEPLEDTKLRVPKEVLKARNRAVTLEDFEVLAKQTPGGQVARAEAIATTSGRTTRVDADGEETDVPDCCDRGIRVMVITQSLDPKPQPSEATLRLVCAYLDERRLITTPLVVAGPAYRELDISIEVAVRGDQDLRTVKTALSSMLQGYFHPLTGGRNGSGIALGAPVIYSEILRQVMSVEGITRVASLRFHKLLVEYSLESAAVAAVSGDVAAEVAAFSPRRPVTEEIVHVMSPSIDSDAVTEAFFTVAAYDCDDMPVDTTELPSLREARISVSYDRAGGTR
jgi:hypothetical protein